MTQFRTTRRTILGACLAVFSWGKAAEAKAGHPTSPSVGTDSIRTSPPHTTALDDHGEKIEREVLSLSERVHANGISLASFGYRGDGITDDTAAWREAIAFAASNNIRTILIPAGISLVRTAIVDVAHPLPPGLTFIGEGATVDSPYAGQSRLKFVGAGVCWDIKFPSGGPESTGRWMWEHLTFQCTDPEATMFSFNDPLTHMPSDDAKASRYMYLLHVGFRNILAIGGRGTGDFIRAAKTFHLTIDDQSAIYGWRRALWGKGCDNWRIQCRLAANNRSIMFEAANTLGNDNIIDTAFIESVSASFGGEAAYAVWDSAAYTTIRAGGLFEGTGARAHLFLNGVGTAIEGPRFSFGIPFWHLGPDGREIVMTSPRVSSFDAGWAPIFDVPTSWNFGEAQSDYRMTVIDAPQNMQRILDASDQRGRLRLVDSPMLGGGLYQAPPASVVTRYGVLPVLTCQAANGGFFGYGSVGGRPIEGIVRDPGVPGGYAIKLGTASGSGVGLLFVIGKSLAPAPYKVHTRNRMSTSKGDIVYIATRNGAFLRFLTPNASMQYAQPVPDDLDLTGCRPGDVIGIEMYCRSGTANVFLDFITLMPIAD